MRLLVVTTAAQAVLTCCSRAGTCAAHGEQEKHQESVGDPLFSSIKYDGDDFDIGGFGVQLHDTYELEKPSQLKSTRSPYYNTSDAVEIPRSYWDLFDADRRGISVSQLLGLSIPFTVPTDGSVDQPSNRVEAPSLADTPSVSSFGVANEALKDDSEFVWMDRKLFLAEDMPAAAQGAFKRRNRAADRDDYNHMTVEYLAEGNNLPAKSSVFGVKSIIIGLILLSITLLAFEGPDYEIQERANFLRQAAAALTEGFEAVNRKLHSLAPHGINPDVNVALLSSALGLLAYGLAAIAASLWSRVQLQGVMSPPFLGGVTGLIITLLLIAFKVATRFRDSGEIDEIFDVSSIAVGIGITSLILLISALGQRKPMHHIVFETVQQH